MQPTNIQEYKTAGKHSSKSLITGVKFAKINKCNTLSEYKQQVKNGEYYLEDIFIEKIVIVDDMDWSIITKNLLNDCGLWEKIGGSTYIGEDEEIINSDKWFHELTPEQQEDYRNNNATLTVIIINKDSGDSFYVNTEGYEYARYVGVK